MIFSTIHYIIRTGFILLFQRRSLFFIYFTHLNSNKKTHTIQHSHTDICILFNSLGHGIFLLYYIDVYIKWIWPQIFISFVLSAQPEGIMKVHIEQFFFVKYMISVRWTISVFFFKVETFKKNWVNCSGQSNQWSVFEHFIFQEENYLSLVFLLWFCRFLLCALFWSLMLKLASYLEVAAVAIAVVDMAVVTVVAGAVSFIFFHFFYLLSQLLYKKYYKKIAEQLMLQFKLDYLVHNDPNHSILSRLFCSENQSSTSNMHLYLLLFPLLLSIRVYLLKFGIFPFSF